MGQQKIDSRWLLCGKRLIDRDRVIADVYNAKKAGIEASVRRCAEERERLTNGRMTTAAASERAVAVVGNLVAVK
jgi:hypothetical protein